MAKADPERGADRPAPSKSPSASLDCRPVRTAGSPGPLERKDPFRGQGQAPCSMRCQPAARLTLHNMGGEALKDAALMPKSMHDR